MCTVRQQFATFSSNAQSSGILAEHGVVLRWITSFLTVSLALISFVPFLVLFNNERKFASFNEKVGKLEHSNNHHFFCFFDLVALELAEKELGITSKPV